MLHNKIVSKPEVASCMAQYINEQVENKNNIEVNLAKARHANFQLHFVGYNFIVSATSSTTQVRMTQPCTQRQISASMMSHNLHQEMFPVSKAF